MFIRGPVNPVIPVHGITVSISNGNGSLNTSKIATALSRLFQSHRLVFWHDPAREFIDLVPTLALEDTGVLRLDTVGALEIKIRIETDDPTGRYLLYAPFEEPDPEDDWLLDIRLYSGTFRADRAALLLDELGLSNHHLRGHLEQRRAFFENRERVGKLKALVSPSDLADDLDLKLIAVLVRAEQPDWFTVVRALFHGFPDGDSGNALPSGLPALWRQMERFGLIGFFLRQAERYFGYVDETPSPQRLLTRLMVTDFAARLTAPVPPTLAHFLLPDTQRANVFFCLNQWRDSLSARSTYDRMASLVAKSIQLGDCLDEYEPEALLEVQTFAEVERAVAKKLRDRLRATGVDIDLTAIRQIAQRRQDGHWVSETDESFDRRAIRAVYDALIAAAEFFGLRNRYADGFVFESAAALYQAYETDLYRFDLLYRRFCEQADRAEARGWNILKDLRSDIENAYTNGYLVPLGLAWGKFVEPADGKGLLRNWTIAGVPLQRSFYDRIVGPRLRDGARRVFVVISDGFRYEAARELTDLFNGQYRFKASLTSQLGVAPSYTALGMASLLPHHVLAYKPNGEVLADGAPTGSTIQRNAVLETVGGIAVKNDELLSLKREQGRELVRDRRVVYVYHNAIDAAGDSAATENDTFVGVRKALTELGDIVGFLINSLNATHVFVTADHGFLFQESSPGVPEKTALPEKPSGTVIAKKRYLIGFDLPLHPSVWRGETAVTAGADGGMQFWTPKGANLFHFTGGARYIHGGLMPQEIVVPVIEVTEADGKNKADTQDRKVVVHTLGVSHKITTSRHRFEFIQTEPVGERVKPVRLRIGLYAEIGESVTNVETVTFDSESSTMDERRKALYFALRDGIYSKTTPYYLILRDVDTDIELERLTVIIDRAFADDF